MALQVIDDGNPTVAPTRSATLVEEELEDPQERHIAQAGDDTELEAWTYGVAIVGSVGCVALACVVFWRLKPGKRAQEKTVDCKELEQRTALELCNIQSVSGVSDRVDVDESHEHRNSLDMYAVMPPTPNGLANKQEDVQVDVYHAVHALSTPTGRLRNKANHREENGNGNEDMGAETVEGAADGHVNGAFETVTPSPRGGGDV